MPSAGALWFGRSLPQQLQGDFGLQAQDAGPAALSFVEVQSVSPSGSAQAEPLPFSADRVIGLSECGLYQLGELIRADASGSLQIDRLICPVAVFDFTADGLLLRELRHGLTAADLQAQLDTRLWAGPELRELDPF